MPISKQLLLVPVAAGWNVAVPAGYAAAQTIDPYYDGVYSYTLLIGGQREHGVGRGQCGAGAEARHCRYAGRNCRT